MTTVSYGQRQTDQILPRTTDPEISTNLEAHYVALNPAETPRNRLFVFLPGTGGTPAFYHRIVHHAADLGFHAVGLNYPNAEAINDLCGGANTDLDCYGSARLEVLEGTDRSPLVTVNRANSIENRLIKLLVHLQSRFPNDGWGQFLAANQSVNWPLLVVAGHSQGGGHAGIIGRFHPVARVIMFAAMDFNARTLSPANWIAKPEMTPNATPPERFFGFSHQSDERVNFAILATRVWPAYGLTKLGPLVNVEATSFPYSHTRTLTSNLSSQQPPSPILSQYHSIIVVDPSVPERPDGTPVYAPVWTYLLIEPADGPPPPDTESPVISRVELSRYKVKPKEDPTLVIAWTAQDNVGIVRQDVFFAVDGVNFSTMITAQLPQNIQILTWRVPTTFPKTKQGRVKVVSYDEAGNRGEGISQRLVLK